jgi:hypothetical protein
MRFRFTSKVRPCDTRGVSLTDKGAREQCVAFQGVVSVSGSRGEIFQQSMNKWYRSPEMAEGDKSVCDTVTTKKNKMGAACKTSVALRASGAGKGQGQGQGQDGVCFKVMGQESNDVDV